MTKKKEPLQEGMEAAQGGMRDTLHTDAGPSDADIYAQAERVLGGKPALDDLRRFAAGSGNPDSRRRDETEDRQIRRQYYRGWTEKDFQKLLDILEGRAVEQRQVGELKQEIAAREAEDQGRVEEVMQETAFEALLGGLADNDRDEMYQELLPLLDDDAFDEEAFMAQFGLDESVYGSWTRQDWRALLDYMIER